jgi:hypothetical protein
MIAFSNPHIVEQAWQDVGRNFQFVDHIYDLDAKLIEGLSPVNQVLYGHYDSNTRHLEELSVKFHAFLHNFQHVMNEHLGPLQEIFPNPIMLAPVSVGGSILPPMVRSLGSSQTTLLNPLLPPSLSDTLTCHLCQFMDQGVPLPPLTPPLALPSTLHSDRPSL